MCGRCTLSTPVERLAEEFGLTGKLPDLQPSYNVAPTREVPAVVSGGEGCRLEMLRWGLIPSWADDPRLGSRMIMPARRPSPRSPLSGEPSRKAAA
jgi:putative SOS response-associated peptidase YedK